ncbi:palmitoyltransferase ZDHHC23 [Diachasma alloeum]|uniref:palmitoyltransferase ZDHHC23 n=1 Tax=Diachasma alloeum TaxID=454923 RepID=UPI000738440F|nr:palmitoyltransferase ZDHHC23 [Diachasma alloeum]
MNILNKLRNLSGWRSGTKQVSIDATIPLIALPVLTLIAAQTIYLTVIVFLLTPIIIYHLHHNFLRFLPRSKFFLMWTITSVIMLMLVFEMCVVPLLEILFEENCVFMAGVVGGIFCGVKTKSKSDSALQNDSLEHDSEVGRESEEVCLLCKKPPPARTYHCRTCQTCVANREYHCKWLDCCIGSSNLRWYLSCLLCSAVAFIYGSNLTMTSVCHPFILIGTILLPDDCSDVYHQLDLALCLVSAIYSLLIGLVVLSYLIYHIYLILLRTTAQERRISSQSRNEYNGLLTNISTLVCHEL